LSHPRAANDIVLPIDWAGCGCCQNRTGPGQDRDPQRNDDIRDGSQRARGAPTYGTTHCISFLISKALARVGAQLTGCWSERGIHTAACAAKKQKKCVG
jgi:hypothetical protein